jgi:hypothetical protein
MWRSLLKTTKLYQQTAHKATTAEVLQPYAQKTRLLPEDLVFLYTASGWKARYGGPKWAAITQTLIDLRKAIDEGNAERSSEICRKARVLRHNSDSLIPDGEAWRTTPYLREKWPTLCE